jgi:hypothetical protein
MPMSTTLFAVSADTIKNLKANPAAIVELDAKDQFSTYLWTTIPYFLTEGEGDEDEGDEDEGDEDSHPLANVLTGTSSVDCNRLECGNFYVFDPDDVVTLSAELAAVKSVDIKNRVLEADLEEVLDGEVWEELEQQDLTEPEDVAKNVLDDIKRLKAFYVATAKNKFGIVGYTT